MNKIPIITMGASDNKLVPIRGTVGKSALQFFADGLLVTPAAGSMTELYATEEALRIFYGWGEMCMIKAKTDGPKAAQKSHYTITKNGFVDPLNQDGAKLLQAENL